MTSMAGLKSTIFLLAVLFNICDAAITLSHVSSVLLPSSFADVPANYTAWIESLEAPYIGGAGVVTTTVTQDGTPEYWPTFENKMAVSQMLKGGAEQSAWHAAHKIIVSIGEGGIVTIIDASASDGALKIHQAIDLGATLTDVDVCGDHIVVTAEGAAGCQACKASFGKLHFLKIDAATKTATHLVDRTLDTGYLPDMVYVTSDCKTVITANEGEATFDASGMFVNPEGSVSVFHWGTNTFDEAPIATNMVDFTPFNDHSEQYVAMGVNWVLRPENADSSFMTLTTCCSFSQDLEPEYLAMSTDGNTLFVGLQENNAIVTVDIEDPTNPALGKLFPLELQDWSKYNIDTSDKDDGAHMQMYPNVYGLGQPDTIKLFRGADGADYLVMALEGDAKEYEEGDHEWTDEEKGAKFAAQMTADTPLELKQALADSNKLSRTRVSSARGAINNGPFDASIYEKIYLYGSRGFAIYRVSNDAVTQVYESGDLIEKLHMTHFPKVFNSEMNEDDFSENLEDGHDSRSDNKGAEPEGVEVATLSDGRTIAFVSCERTSVITVFDITDPAAPKFQSVVGPGDTSVSFADAFSGTGALPSADPEDMHFIPAAESPLGVDTLLVVGALNGVINLYKIEDAPDYVEEKADYVAAHGAGASIKAADAGPCTAAPGNRSKVLGHYKMMGVKLGDLNPFLHEDDMEMPSGDMCKDRNDWFACADFPAVFSGMTMAQGSKTGNAVFIGISDRGPNQGCGDLADVKVQVTDDSGKGFPAPAFSPTFAKMTLNTNGLVEVQDSCYLKQQSGAPASGISTTPADDLPFGSSCQTEMLPFDHNGFDTEDIHQIPGTPYCWAVDEYSPSAFVFHCDFSNGQKCGTVEARYVPQSMKLPMAGYKVHSIIPDVYTNRRKNRGMEGGAVSPDGKLAYAFLQSPMLGDATNVILRFLEFNITDPLNAELIGEYIYKGEDPARNPSPWTSPNVAKDLKISAAQWYGEDATMKRLLVLERAKKQVKVFLVDLTDTTAYTNVLGTQEAATLSYEALTPDQFEATYGSTIKTVPKQLVFDTATTDGWDYSAKQEGMALINDCVMALGDDNDFGLEGNTESGVVIVQLGTCINQLVMQPCQTYGAFTAGEAMLTPQERMIHDLTSKIALLESTLASNTAEIVTINKEQDAEDNDDDDGETGVIVVGFLVAIAFLVVGVIFVKLVGLEKKVAIHSKDNEVSVI